MNEAEFREKLLKEFFTWVSSREKPETSWLMDLEEWAGREFHKAWDRQENQK